MKLSEISVVLFGEDLKAMEPERRLASELLLTALRDVGSVKEGIRNGVKVWMELGEDVAFGARWLCGRLNLPFESYEKFLLEHEYTGKVIRRKDYGQP